MKKKIRFENISDIFKQEAKQQYDYIKSFIFDSVILIKDLVNKGIIYEYELWDAVHYYECCEQLFKKITKMNRYYFDIVKKHRNDFPECVNKSYLEQYIANCSSVDRDFYFKSPPKSSIRYLEEDLNAFSFKHLFFTICQTAQREVD